MTPVNKARGEARIRIGDIEFVLVPSYSRLAAIEEATGIGAFEALDRIDAGSIKVATAIIACASDTKLERSAIGELILQNDGMTPLLRPLYGFMAQVASGFRRVNELLEKDAEGEAAQSADTKSDD